MTEKDAQAPKRKPFVVEALDGVSGFFRAITEELRSSPSHEEQELEVIYEELEELRGAVQEIKNQGVRDRQVHLETGQRLERLAISTLERVEALERSLKPRDLEEARWLKRVLEWLKYLILLLLAGNVWAWTRSLWGDMGEPAFKYPYDPTDGRENLEAPASEHRVLRGGSFNSIRWYVRCAARNWDDPNDWNGGGGFRVVVSPFTSEL